MMSSGAIPFSVLWHLGCFDSRATRRPQYGERIAPEDIIQARLAADMLPFAYQVKSTAVHSLGAIEGVRRAYSRPTDTAPRQFCGAQARIAETLAALEAIEASEVDASSVVTCALRSATAH